MGVEYRRVCLPTSALDVGGVPGQPQQRWNPPRCCGDAASLLSFSYALLVLSVVLSWLFDCRLVQASLALLQSNELAGKPQALGALWKHNRRILPRLKLQLLFGGAQCVSMVSNAEPMPG